MTACRDVAQRLQPLLDDLLQEEEYQTLHLHINGCQRCQTHVRSVGSLSYAVKMLGAVQAPADLSSTILFRLRAQPPVTRGPQPPSRSRRAVLVGTVGCVLIALVSVGIFYYYRKFAPSRSETVELPAVVTAVIRHPTPADPEAKAAYQQLQAIANALGVERPASSAAQTEQPEPSQPTGRDTERIRAQARTSDTRTSHWHVSSVGESERLQLANAMRLLGLSPDYETP